MKIRPKINQSIDRLSIRSINQSINWAFDQAKNQTINPESALHNKKHRFYFKFMKQHSRQMIIKWQKQRNKNSGQHYLHTGLATEHLTLHIGEIPVHPVGRVECGHEVPQRFLVNRIAQDRARVRLAPGFGTGAMLHGTVRRVPAIPCPCLGRSCCCWTWKTSPSSFHRSCPLYKSIFPVCGKKNSQKWDKNRQ